MGVWLPLALADLIATIAAPWLGEESDAGQFSRSKLLESWHLPTMARVAAAIEEERERREKAERVKVLQAQLAAMQEKYGGSKNADQVHK